MVDTPATAWRTTLKRRVLVAAVGLLAWSAAIEARLAYLQIARHADLAARGERQSSRTLPAAASRGDILDRNGHRLAFSVDADSIYAVPTEIGDAHTAAVSLCRALDDCTAAEREALANRIRRGKAFAYVRRQVTPEQAQRVAALQLEGVGFVKESRRFYPNRELASHLLGYVGVDNEGLAGIESTHDKLLKGEAGKVLIQIDAKRHAFTRIEKSSTAGATLWLTIDQYLQHIAERELRAGVEENRAAGGTAIIMDPATGEILALANWPTFNPNTFAATDQFLRRNRAVQDLYEPGSTFKIVTASAALEQRLVRPEDEIDVRGGLIHIGKRVVHDTHDYGILKFTDVIVKSSNVGAIKIGLRLGAERLGIYATRFGFGKPSSPDFPGESAGILWDPSKQNDSALASMAMGYQVGVTPLQMAAAVSAIANGGELIQPRVVRAVIKGGRRMPVPRKVVRRAIEQAVATELTGIMEQVVERGTATAARMPGYTIAGKTGTAAKLINGAYSTSVYNASFVGFVPSRAPAFTIVVVLDSPRAKGHTGGVAAAPVFKRIAEAAMRQYGIAPTVNPTPPILVVRHNTTDGPKRATPAVDTYSSVPPPVDPAQESDNVFPDVRGLGAREALRVLARLGVTGHLNGLGIVTAQRPAPGTPIEGTGNSAVLWLERLPTLAAVADVEP